MARRILVIATTPPDPGLLRGSAPDLFADDIEAKIVSPASDVSFAQWLANDEDEARAEAERTAEQTAQAVSSAATVTDAGIGDTDLVQAARDALVDFDADEILLVLAEDSTWIERAGVETFEDLGLPVRIVASHRDRA